MILIFLIFLSNLFASDLCTTFVEKKGKYSDEELKEKALKKFIKSMHQDM